MIHLRGSERDFGDRRSADEAGNSGSRRRCCCGRERWRVRDAQPRGQAELRRDARLRALHVGVEFAREHREPMHTEADRRDDLEVPVDGDETQLQRTIAIRIREGAGDEFFARVRGRYYDLSDVALAFAFLHQLRS